MDGDAGPSRHTSPRFVPHAIASRYSTHQTAPANADRPRNYVAHSMLEGWFGKGKAASATTAESEPASSPSSPPPVTPPPEQPGPSPEALAEAAAWQDHAETDEERRQRERVEGWRDDLFRTSPMLRFMARHLSLVSCDPFADNGNGTGTSRLEITACPPNIAGGFSPNNEKASQSGILICSNRIMDKGHLEDTLAHEMVHWWDHCRFRVDWSNLRHHACSEVRAAALSGDCKLGREWARRNFGGFTKQHQVCARRRAVLSVMANPACKGGQEEAEKVVDEVFPQCFADTRPFDEIY